MTPEQSEHFEHDDAAKIIDPDAFQRWEAGDQFDRLQVIGRMVAARDKAKAIAALNPSPEPISAGWQPIETAPTDGRDLIMTSTDWNGDILVGGFAFGKWRENPSPEGCSFAPTHWMPIPPIPTATAEGSADV